MTQFRRFALFGLLLLGLVVAGCGGSEKPAQKAEAPKAEEAAKPAEAAAPAPAEAAAPAGKVLSIGTLSPLTGSSAADGHDIAEGVKVAVAVFKAQGGIPGYDDIQVVSEDSACDGRQAVAGANKLLSMKVAGVIGAYCSSATLPASEVLDEGPIPMITPASTNPDVTKRGLKHMWRMCGIDEHQSKAAVDFMKNVLKAKTVFIVDDKTTYSQHLADFVAEEAAKEGLQVMAHEHVNEGDMDFSAILTKLKNANPDVFYMSLQSSAMGIPFIKQFRQMGITAQVLSQDAVFHPNFIKEAPDASQGVFFTYGFIDENADLYKQFKAKFTEMTGNDTPGGYAFYAFDSATALLNAIKAAGSTAPDAIRAELLKMDLQGITKKIHFEENGDSGSNYVILKVEGDKFVPYYNPETGKLF
ncbi:MAG: branched-chain amino acid ABC transporter substrate-binding protein [Desulfovibrionaceae bacterium]